MAFQTLLIYELTSVAVDGRNSKQANKLIRKHLEEKNPANEEEAYRLIDELKWRWTHNAFKRAKLEQLRKFLDDNHPGDDICDKTQPLQLIVETPYDPGTGVPEDRVYLATYGKTPDYERVVLDELKKLGLIEDNSQISDYSFLFSAPTK